MVLCKTKNPTRTRTTHVIPTVFGLRLQTKNLYRSSTVFDKCCPFTVIVGRYYSTVQQEYDEPVAFTLNPEYFYRFFDGYK